MRPLMAGWRAYRLDEPITLAGARGPPGRRRGRGRGPARRDAAPGGDHQRPSTWATSGRCRRSRPPPGGLRAAGAATVTVAVIDSGRGRGATRTSPRGSGTTRARRPTGSTTTATASSTTSPGGTSPTANAGVYDARRRREPRHPRGRAPSRPGANNGTGVAGVADNARIMPLKFIRTRRRRDLERHRGHPLRRRRMGARVINASFGSTAYSPALCDAIAAGRRQGGPRSWPRPGTTGRTTTSGPVLAGQLPRDDAPLRRRDHVVRRPRLVLQPGPRRWTWGRPGRACFSTIPGNAVRLQVGDLDGGPARLRRSRPACWACGPSSSHGS